MAATPQDINLRLNVLGDQANKSIRDYREEIKLLSMAMSDAAAKGDTKSFEEFGRRLGEAKNDVKDFNDQLKYSDPGELLAGMTKLGQGMVGSFGAVTGIMELVGSKNEAIQEIQKKSMVIIQVLTSLESARQLLEGKGLIQGLAGQAKKLVMMGAIKAGMISEIAVTQGATIAQLELNAAVLANPYVLAAAAIIALVAAMTYFIVSENAAEEAARNAQIAQDNYNLSMKEAIEIGTEARSGLEQSIDKYNLLTGAISETDNAIESIIEAYKKESDAMIVSTTTALLAFETRQKAENEAFMDSRGLFESSTDWLKRRDTFEKQQAKELAEFRKTTSKNFVDLKKKEQQDIDNIKISDVKDTYDKQKANTQKIQSFEEGIAKSIANLRVSLIADEYEQKKASIQLSYKDDQKNLNQLKDENVKLNDIYTGQKSSIDNIIKSQQQNYNIAYQIQDSAERTYAKKEAEGKKLGYAGAALLSYTLKEYETLQATTAETARVKGELEGSMAMTANIVLEQEKSNNLLAKATRELSTRKNLELEILQNQRLLKTEADAILANENLKRKIAQMNVDLIIDEFERSKAQLQLNHDIEEANIKGLEKELLLRKEILNSTILTQREGETNEDFTKRQDDLEKAKKSIEEQTKDIATYKLQVDQKLVNDLIDLNNDKNDKNKKADVKNEVKTAEEILEIRKKLNAETLDLKIQNAIDGSKIELDLQKKSLYLQAKEQIAATNKLYEDKQISLEEYQDNIEQINERVRQDDLALEREYWKKRTDIAIESADLISNGLLEINNNLIQSRLEQDTIDMNKRIERNQSESDNKYESDKLYIEKSVSDERERDIQLQELAIKKKQEDERLAIEQRTAERNMQIRKFEADRDNALAKIAISTAIGIATAISEAPMIGGLPGSAIAAAAGILQAAAVKAQKMPQYARGTLFQGPSHAEGGINANLEGGEAVVNKHSMAIPAFRQIVSQINQAGGGVPYPSIGGASSNGLNMNATIDPSVIQDIVSQVVGQVVSIPVVVQERDVTQTQRVVSTYESQSKF